MLPGLDFESLPGGKDDRKGHELFRPHQVVEDFRERFLQNFSFGGVSSGSCALQMGWRDRPRALYARQSRRDEKTVKIGQPFSYDRESEGKIGPRDFVEGSSILIVVPTGIRVVVVPMMPLVPAVPPIFVRVAVVSVARVVLAIVIRSLVRRADVNAEAFIRS